MIPLRRLLGPVSWAYGAAAAVRRTGYEWALLPQVRLDAPVISVGGLSLGGSGKTPTALHLARLLGRDWGLRVGVVHGGYGGRAGRRVQRVTLTNDRDGRWYGDEPTLLARRLPSAIVVRGPDKVAAARCCIAEGAQILVLDDGFQHLRLARDLDILVHARPLDLPLPRGDGRELPYVAAQADLRWWHDRSGELRNGSTAPVGQGSDSGVVSTLEPSELVSPAGDHAANIGSLRGARVHLLAGIAHPDAFSRLVERCGAEVVGTTFVRDHRIFSARALQRVAVAARHADLVLCSEKDAARCPQLLRQVGALALRCDSRIVCGVDLLTRSLASVLGPRGAARCSERRKLSR